MKFNRELFNKELRILKESLHKESIINTSQLKTKDEWIRIFKDWSKKMDNLYKGSDRHDATEWSDNPADWMKPYNDDVFMAWSEHDVGSPEFNRHFSKIKLKESLHKESQIIDKIKHNVYDIDSTEPSFRQKNVDGYSLYDGLMNEPKSGKPALDKIAKLNVGQSVTVDIDGDSVKYTRKESIHKEALQPEAKKAFDKMNIFNSKNKNFAVEVSIEELKGKVVIYTAGLGAQSVEDLERRIKVMNEAISLSKILQKDLDKLGWENLYTN